MNIEERIRKAEREAEAERLTLLLLAMASDIAWQTVVVQSATEEYGKRLFEDVRARLDEK